MHCDLTQFIIQYIHIHIGGLSLTIKFFTSSHLGKVIPDIFLLHSNFKQKMYLNSQHVKIKFFRTNLCQRNPF